MVLRALSAFVVSSFVFACYTPPPPGGPSRQPDPELHNSSRPHLPPGADPVVLNAPADEVSEAPVSAFTRRGFPLARAGKAETGVLMQFRGPRKTINVVKRYEYSQQTVNYSWDIGSSFYVLVETEGDGTRVTALGRPTVDEEELCATGDRKHPTHPPRCQRRTALSSWSHEAITSGRQEAEAITGVPHELTLPTLTGRR